MKQSILLIGGGGHAKSVIDSLKNNGEYNIVGILDLKDRIGECINEVEIIGSDDDMEKFYNLGIKKAFITLGSIGDSSKRVEIYNKLKKIGYEVPSIVDNTAIVSEDCKISEGVFIGKRVILNSNCKIGCSSIINSGSIIEHDVVVEDFVHVAPGSVICGNVNIESNCHIGAGTTIIQGRSIGRNTLIGAGSVVVRDIDSFKKAYGNPCKVV